MKFSRLTDEEFELYVAARDLGETPKQIDRFAESHGPMGRIILLCKLFDLDLTRAKAICVTEEGTLEALSKYQETLIESIMAVLNEIENEDRS